MLLSLVYIHKVYQEISSIYSDITKPELLTQSQLILRLSKEEVRGLANLVVCKRIFDLVITY